MAMLLPALAFAINGLNLTGYGTESSALGGPDAPLSRDTFAANLNPAGLAQISSKRFDGYVSGFTSPDNSHTDSLNYRKPVDKGLYYGAYGGFGYAQRVADSQVTVGVVLVVQGGNGTGYKHLRTMFNTSDEISGVFGVSKLATAVGWNATDRLRLGAGVGLSYSSAVQSVFPDTSVLNTFYGSRVKDLSGTSWNARFGMQYDLSDDITVGAYYGTPTKLVLKGGTMRVNYSADPAIGSVVRYDRAELRGLGLPQELAIGITFRPTAPLMVAVQGKWYPWSQALKSSTLLSSSPRSATAPATITQTGPINARDQAVISIGAAYDYDANTILRAGVNYCNRIIPDQNLSPIFAVMQTRHWAVGVERKIDAEWSAGLTGERYPKKMVTYSTPGGLFGANAAESNGGVVWTMMASRRW